MTQPRLPRPLSKSAIEDLADARLVLDTAAHNLQALVRNQPGTEIDQALDNACDQVDQVLRTLHRVRTQRSGSPR